MDPSIPSNTHWKINVAWIAVVAMAGSLLAAFRHLALPDGDLRKASIKEQETDLHDPDAWARISPTQ